MDSPFFYKLTLHQGDDSGPATATWVTRLPLVQQVVDQVVVIPETDGNTSPGMYVWDGMRWRFILPYTEVAQAIIEGAILDVFYNVVDDFSGLPSTVQLWRNGTPFDGDVVTGGSGYVWIGISASVVTQYVLPVATSTVLGGVKQGANILIAPDGTISVNISGSGVQTVSGQGPDSGGNVVVQATDNNATTGVSLIANSGATTGNIKLKTIVAGANITVAPDVNGNLVINGSGSSGSVQSVALALPSIFNVSGSPVTSTGTLTGTLVGQNANLIFAGPTSGSADIPAFRALVNADIPVATGSAVGGVIVGAGLTVSVSGLLSNAGVTTFNTRSGAVTLQASDLVSVGGALLASPAFTGTPTAPTPTLGDSTTKIATTAFVSAALGAYAPLASPALTGTPTAPTQPNTSNNTDIATTAFVQSIVSAIAGGLNYQGTWNATTNTPTLTSGVGTRGFLYVVSVAGNTLLDGNSTWNVGDFVSGNGSVYQRIPAQTTGVVSFNARTGVVTLTSLDVTTALGFTPATAASVALLAPLASPTFTGTPSAPTATAGTNTTQIATTAFVTSNFAVLASPAFTGTPTAPTPTAGDNSTKIATTAFVAAVAGASVTSFNTRTGAVTLQASDVTGVGGALLASPAFTGTPTAPTATVGTNTTQLATTAYVMAAVAGSTAGVSSFNTRTGAVTLTGTDVTAAGGALLASPTFTGIPAAPTAAVGTSSAQIATTAFVATSYAPLANPTFTGVPRAPTATIGANSTQLATTAYVFGATQSQAGVVLSNANVTLTAAQGSTPFLKFAGTLTANVIVTVPNPGNWNIYNATTGAFTVTLTNGVGASFVVPQANTVSVVSDSVAGVLSATSSGGAVTSVAGRTGIVTLTVADISGAAPLASPVHTGRTQSPAYSFSTAALGSVSSTQTLNLGLFSEWTMTLIGNTTFVFTNTLAANTSQVVFLKLTNAGSFTLTWPSGTKFAAGVAPTFTAAGVDVVGIMYDTDTATYMVFVVGLGVA